MDHLFLRFSIFEKPPHSQWKPHLHIFCGSHFSWPWKVSADLFSRQQPCRLSVSVGHDQTQPPYWQRMDISDHQVMVNGAWCYMYIGNIGLATYLGDLPLLVYKVSLTTHRRWHLRIPSATGRLPPEERILRIAPSHLLSADWRLGSHGNSTVRHRQGRETYSDVLTITIYPSLTIIINLTTIINRPQLLKGLVTWHLEDMCRWVKNQRFMASGSLFLNMFSAWWFDWHFIFLKILEHPIDHYFPKNIQKYFDWNVIFPTIWDSWLIIFPIFLGCRNSP